MKECMICLDTEWLTETKCGHIICIECLFKLEKDECPMCRREIKKTLPKALWKHLEFTPEIKKPNYLDFNNLDDFPPLR